MTLEQLIELSSIGVAIFILLVLYLRGVSHISQKEIWKLDKRTQEMLEETLL